MNLPKFIITLDGVLRLGEKSRDKRQINQEFTPQL